MSTEPNDPGDPPPAGNVAAPSAIAPPPAVQPAAGDPAPASPQPERQSAAGLAVIGGLGVIAIVVSTLIWVIAVHQVPPGGGAIAALAQPALLETEQLLDRLSFPPGKIDGVFDEDTASAIEAYQQAAGLTVDGQPSPALLNELRDVAGSATP
jgi:hypothetical protein